MVRLPRSLVTESSHSTSPTCSFAAVKLNVMVLGIMVSTGSNSMSSRKRLHYKRRVHKDGILARELLSWIAVCVLCSTVKKITLRGSVIKKGISFIKNTPATKVTDSWKVWKSLGIRIWSVMTLSGFRLTGLPLTPGRWGAQLSVALNRALGVMSQFITNWLHTTCSKSCLDMLPVRPLDFYAL